MASTQSVAGEAAAYTDHKSGTVSRQSKRGTTPKPRMVKAAQECSQLHRRFSRIGSV